METPCLGVLMLPGPDLVTFICYVTVASSKAPDPFFVGILQPVIVCLMSTWFRVDKAQGYSVRPFSYLTELACCGIVLSS